MNYIGSKLSLLQFLEESINEVVDDSCKIFCDLFAGTGIVGSYFKQKGYQVIANDIQYYSYALNRHYIGNHKVLPFSNLVKTLPSLSDVGIADRKNIVCNYLSNIVGEKGFVYSNFCWGGTRDSSTPRQYFSDTNGLKCDAIRQKIESWQQARLISEDEYFFLIASLLEAIDKRANTASVYGAFLKQTKKSAQIDMVMNPAKLIINDTGHQVFNEDVNELVKKISGDIMYLDPPYNHRQYATNYHVLETVARYDNPQVFGKSGLREYSKQKSLYCSKPRVVQKFKDLVLNAKTKYIFLSYNNEGLMSLSDIKEIMMLRGKYGCFTKPYNRFRADKPGARNYKGKETIEYLHYVKCAG